MKGDFSRSTFDRRKHYNSVLLQQGRVQLDSDWNEHLDIEVYLRQARAKDVIGYTGAPRLGGGLEVGVSADEKDLTLSAGRLYVDGIMCENEAEVAFSAQPDFPKASLPTETGSYLAYLDVWPRHITALEDPALREVALGGPETTTRIKTVWQLRLQKVDDSLTGKDFGPDWKPTSAITTIQTTGSMAAFAAKAGATPDNCLYRVEIHDDSKSSKGPTFKWSRDNGTVVGRIEKIIDNIITVSMIGCQPEAAFAPAQWVELSDEEHLLHGEPGIFVQLRDVQGNELTVMDPFTPPALGALPTIRRWDSPSKPASLTFDEAIALENGVQVSFTKGEYRSGDYWLFPTRAITRQVEWPQDAQGKPLPQPPHGIEHHYGRLALVKWNKSKKTFARQEDCRFIFSSLADLKELNVVQAELDAPDGAVYVDHGGNVGIGTTKPEATLEVNGAVQINGSIKNPMWNAIQVFNMKEGPLPLTSGPWETGGGTLLIFASGSGYSWFGSNFIGMSIRLDQNIVGVAKVFTNEAKSHKAFTTNALVVTNILAGPHTLTLEPLGFIDPTGLFSVSDEADFFSVTVLELPFPTKYPDMLVEALQLDFGAPSPQRVTLPLVIRNKGDAPLVIDKVAISLDDFYLVNPPVFPWTIQPHSAQTLTVGLGPAASNVFRQASLTLYSNDLARPTLAIPLIGRDIHIEVTPPDRLIFNDIVGAQATLVIRNSGHAPLELTKIWISNTSSVFSILQPPALPLLIPPQGEQRLTVQCGTTGTQNGSLTIESNDPSRPTVTVSLEGSITPYVGGGVSYSGGY